MASPAGERRDSDVRKCGSLRKSKSLHRRYFVLRAASERGAARLECYQSEKKFRAGGSGAGGGSSRPKLALPLHGSATVSKRADSRSKFVLALYTRDQCLALAADSPQEQESWYRAIRELLAADKGHIENGDSDYSAVPGPVFKEVWQVNLRPRGLGHSRNMNGIYRLCLTDMTINLVKLNSDQAAVVLQLMNIRRCGHSENFFFVEVGRSAVTGPGEFWMQVDDSVVAQNMHETILEAMKAMSEEFRLRTKSQSSSCSSSSSSSSSHPISVPPRRYPLPNPPPSQVGLSARRCGGATSPGQRYSFARARTSSDGSGPCSSSSCSSRPASADEVAASPSPGAPLPHQRQGPGKAHLPLSQTWSTPSPSSSGHGSDCACPLRPLGSPGDRGFSSPTPSSSPPPPSSSDGEEEEEYGSSPGTPDPGRFPLAAVHRDYMAMGRSVSSASSPSAAEQGAQRYQRRLLQRACSRGEDEEDDEEEKASERGPSKRAWPAKLATAAGPTAAQGSADNGYMAMLPGVSVAAAQGVGGDDYMAMTPRGSSAPRRIAKPRGGEGGGYMVMSPSGSCSPEGWGREAGGSGVVGSDYMNMSPASRSASCTPPDAGRPRPPGPPPARPRPPGEAADPRQPCYHSLPRCYRQPAPSGPVSCCSYSTGSSSDSLAEAEGGRPGSDPRGPATSALAPARLGGAHGEAGKASTLPRRAREGAPPPQPPSPGEYVSIEFRAPRACAAHAPQPRPPPADYINVGLGPPADPHQGARLVRADPQGCRRRRHCSETFLPPAPPAGRRSSASSESAWPKDGGGGDGRGEPGAEPCAGMSRQMSSGFENGLNYIDLDLGPDSGCAEGLASQLRLYAQTNGSPAFSAYASIDFHKSEELRSHNCTKEDC
uniref:insulin receptor substrate 1-like n=1 Tax=Pristiophorus japonicus TaxID=55135 RepID=UPI00398F1C73